MTFLQQYENDAELAPDYSLFAGHRKFKQRAYSKALEGAEFEAVLIAGGMWEYRFMDDIFHPFRASSFAAEWLPLGRRVGHYLLIFADARQPIVFQPNGEDVWHTRHDAFPSEITAQFDWQGYVSPGEITECLPKERLAFLGKPEFKPDGLEAPENPPELIQRLDWHRALKSDWEIFCIRQANRLGLRAHKAVKEAFEAGGLAEYDLHLVFLRALRAEQADLPYDTVIGLNQNAAVLHHFQLDKTPPAEVRSLLIDAGADYLGYGSDITRTYAQGEGVFADLVESFDALQQDLVRSIQPGLSFADLHKRAELEIARFLMRFEITSMSPESLVETGYVRSFFPHGLGHLLGIQVHDRGGFTINEDGDLSTAEPGQPRMVRQLETGKVFTVEPGVYFIPALLDKLRAGEHAEDFNWTLIDSLIPFGGIRIEDNIHLSGSGAVNLTRDCQK